MTAPRPSLAEIRALWRRRVHVVVERTTGEPLVGVIADMGSTVLILKLAGGGFTLVRRREIVGVYPTTFVRLGPSVGPRPTITTREVPTVTLLRLGALGAV